MRAWGMAWALLAVALAGRAVHVHAAPSHVATHLAVRDDSAHERGVAGVQVAVLVACVGALVVLGAFCSREQRPDDDTYESYNDIFNDKPESPRQRPPADPHCEYKNERGERRGRGVCPLRRLLGE